MQGADDAPGGDAFGSRRASGWSASRSNANTGSRGPAAAAADRLSARDQRALLQGNAAVDSVQISGPFTVDGSRRHPEPAHDLHLPARTGGRPGPACAGSVLSRLPGAPIGARSRTSDRDDAARPSTSAGRRTGGFEAGIQLGARERCWSIRTSCSGSRATRWTCRAGAAYPVQRSGAGVAAVVLPVEQHPGRRAAGPGGGWRARGPGVLRAAGAAHAGRPARRRRWSTTSPGSGCCCATSGRRRRPTRTCSRRSTRTCARRSGARPELFVESQSCARTAASSIC